MTIIFKSLTAALMLAAATAASGCVVHRDADNGRFDRQARESVGVSVGFGDIGFGYSDGYWDNGHRWHRWSNDGERASYRNYQGNHYNDWNHDRDPDEGWHSADATVGVSIGFADIGFGYNDGYWDNGHRWHRWSNDGERASYRNYQGNHYYDWNHDRDPDEGWHEK
jgi:hypothetical protein